MALSNHPKYYFHVQGPRHTTSAFLCCVQRPHTFLTHCSCPWPSPHPLSSCFHSDYYISRASMQGDQEIHGHFSFNSYLRGAAKGGREERSTHIWVSELAHPGLPKLAFLYPLTWAFLHYISRQELGMVEPKRFWLLHMNNQSFYQQSRQPNALWPEEEEKAVVAGSTFQCSVSGQNSHPHFLWLPTPGKIWREGRTQQVLPVHIEIGSPPCFCKPDKRSRWLGSSPQPICLTYLT